MMPSTSVADVAKESVDGKKGQDKDGSESEKEEEIGSLSAFFMVELKTPLPEGLRLSRKNIHFVEIRPQSQDTD